MVKEKSEGLVLRSFLWDIGRGREGGERMGITGHFAEVSKMVEGKMWEEGRWVGRLGG